MEIFATWEKPIDLRVTADGYDLDLDLLLNVPSVYLIGRRFGDTCVPLYVGRTAKLQRRMRQHFDSRRFMTALRSFPNGTRFLAWATFQLRPGQRVHRALGISERGLILHALSEGHELINIKGARTPVDTLHLSGNLNARNIFGQTVLIRK